MAHITHEQAMKGLKRAIELAKATESKPASPESIDEILDRAFLAPRIVNQRTLEDWSERLKSELEAARAERRELQAQLAAMTALLSNLRETDASLTGKIDIASKAVPAIEQRMSRAEQTLAAAAKIASEQVRTLEAVKDRRFEIDRARIEGMIETIATQVMDKLATRLAQEHERRITQASDAVRDAIANSIRAATDEAGRIQARAAQMISRELARIDRVKETTTREIEEFSSGELAKLRSQSDSLVARSEEAANQAAVFSRGAIAGAETAVDNARLMFDKRVSDLRDEIEMRSTVLETQISEFTRFVADHSKRFENDRESIASMILEHSARLSEQINQFATEARSGVEELTRARTESIDVVRKRADVEFRHVSALLEGKESRIQAATTEALGAIDQARQTAVDGLRSCGDRVGGEIGERLRAEAEALSAGMLQAGDGLRDLRDETTRSLTKAAIAIGNLTQESKETLRNCARVATEKMREEFSSRANEDLGAIKASCAEAEIARTELSAAIERASTFDAATLEHASADAQQAAARAIHAAGLLNGAIGKAETLRADVDSAMRDLVELRRQADLLKKREHKSRD